MTTDSEHPGLFGGLVAARADLRIAEIRARPAAEALDAIEAQITPRTRLIALSHVSWHTGAVLPIRELSDPRHPAARRRRPGGRCDSRRRARARLRLLHGLRPEVAARARGDGLPLRPRGPPRRLPGRGAVVPVLAAPGVRARGGSDALRGVPGLGLVGRRAPRVSGLCRRGGRGAVRTCPDDDRALPGASRRARGGGGDGAGTGHARLLARGRSARSSSPGSASRESSSATSPGRAGSAPRAASGRAGTTSNGSFEGSSSAPDPPMKDVCRDSREAWSSPAHWWCWPDAA